MKTSKHSQAVTSYSLIIVREFGSMQGSNHTFDTSMILPEKYRLFCAVIERYFR